MIWIVFHHHKPYIDQWRCKHDCNVSRDILMFFARHQISWRRCQYHLHELRKKADIPRMRLTAQVINDAPVVKDPEGSITLRLRGLNIPYIENLGVTRDMFAAIDLVDNEIIDIKNIPRLPQLQCLLLARNSIISISQRDLGANVSNLESITLAHNKIRNFNGIKGLVGCTRLQEASLLANPITERTNYRVQMIWLIPSLRVLDFQQVKAGERLRGIELFGTKESPSELGRNLLHTVFDDLDADTAAANLERKVLGQEERDMKIVVQRLSDDEREKLITQLKSASTLEEIQRVEAALKG